MNSMLEISLQEVERYLYYEHQPMIVLDSEERIVFCCSNFVKWTGQSRKELTGRSVAGYIRFHEPLVSLYNRFFQIGESSGQIPPLEVLQGPSPRIVKNYIVLGFQIQSEPHFLLILRGAEYNVLQRFAGTFLRDVNLGVLLIDPDFHLVDISEMACRVLGLDKSSILNRSMDEIFASVPNEHRIVQRTLLDGQVVRNQAVSWTNNTERYELLLDSNVLRNQDGEIVGAYVMFKDVTNLRSLEQQVQRSDKLAMIGQIAAGTAHEIRNPLTSIKGFLQMFRNTFTEKGMDKERTYTQVMLDEIDRINELLNEFLLLSKPKHISFEQVDVSKVLQGILPLINNEAILHKVSVNYEPESPSAHIIADKEMLKQVFLNLCKNGIEAMSEGGTLSITEKADYSERWLYIDIHDTGPGIPVFLIDKIFDPFFTTKENGTGLGLSVCQRIIHDIGGWIRVSSKGFGTTFTVGLPLP